MRKRYAGKVKISQFGLFEIAKSSAALLGFKK